MPPCGALVYVCGEISVCLSLSSSLAHPISQIESTRSVLCGVSVDVCATRQHAHTHACMLNNAYAFHIIRMRLCTRTRRRRD